MTARHQPLKAATANRLRNGDVVYLTARGDWSTQLSESCASADAAIQEKLLELAEEAVRSGEVVGPYLLDLERSDGKLQPISQRERIRAARGPSIRLITERTAAENAASGARHV